MLVHSIKYSFKSLLRNKMSLFWTLVFPIALASFMYAGFGNIFNNEQVFKTIPVSIVYEKDCNKEMKKSFDETIKSVEDDSGKKMFDVKDISEDKAKEMLLDNDKDLIGIIYVGKDISIKVAESGYSQTVLKVFVEQYSKYSETMTNIAKENPKKVNDVIKNMEKKVIYYSDVKTSDGNQDNMVTYFYAIFAMSCLFASISSVSRTVSMQASFSALGQRRSVAPTKKFITVLSEFISTECVQFGIECITLLYLVFALKIDFGSKYGFILLLLFWGSSFGVALGMLIGSLKKVSAGAKEGIVVGVSMLFSVLADLCVGGIRDSIQHTCPIINKINPAALIVDSFYSLNVYSTYDRFISNMVTLAILTVIVCLFTVYFMRKDCKS